MFESLLSILWGIHLELEPLQSYDGLAFCASAKLFSPVAVPFYIATSNAQGLQFLHSHQYLSFSVVWFVLIVAVLIGMRCYLIVV